MYSNVEQAFIDGIVQANFPDQPEPVQVADAGVASDAPPAAAGTIRPGAMQGEMRAIPQSPIEAIMEKTGASLEEIGKALDSVGKLNIGGFEIGLRDLVPFVGNSRTETDPLTGKETVIQSGTPQALQKAGRGESLVRGTGFATQLVPDAKDAALDVATTVAPFAKPIGRGAVKAIKATEGMPVGLSIKPVDGLPLQPNVVSTRLPTAVKATEDPLTQNLLSDFGTMKRDPAAFEQNVNLIREYPNFVSKARNPDKRAEDFIEHVKDNLLYLYDQVPEATRNRSRLWYDGARNIVDRWGNEFSQPDQALSGVLAVLSPQKDWFMNVSLGNRVLDIALNKSSSRWDDAMEQTAGRIWEKDKYQPVLDLVRGKTYDELSSPAEKALWLRTFDEAFNDRSHRIVTPEGDFGDVRLKQDGTPYGTGWGSLNEIGKAIAILENPTKENINTMLGSQHKVRNFYNNIYAPNDPSGHVTIDTHAVAAGLMRPLSGNSKEVAHNFGSNIKGERGPANSSITGSQGTYGLYAEAYRRAAQARGVLPREMQSITWEAVRGLFPDTYKTAENAQQIDSIWVRYRKGQISLDEARNEVLRTAGGINPPEWERAGLRGGAAAESGNAANAGELPGAGVPGGSARGSGRKQPAARNSSTVSGGGQAPAMGAQ